MHDGGHVRRQPQAWYPRLREVVAISLTTFANCSLRSRMKVSSSFSLGGWALALHGHGRGTDDLDVLVRRTPENAARIFRALVLFGAQSAPTVAAGSPRLSLRIE